MNLPTDIAKKIASDYCQNEINFQWNNTRRSLGCCELPTPGHTYIIDLKKVQDKITEILQQVELPEEIISSLTKDDSYNTIFKPIIRRDDSFDVMSKKGMLFTGISETLYSATKFYLYRFLPGLIFGNYMDGHSKTFLVKSFSISPLKLSKEIVKTYYKNKIKEAHTSLDLETIKKDMLSPTTSKILTTHRNPVSRFMECFRHRATSSEIEMDNLVNEKRKTLTV